MSFFRISWYTNLSAHWKRVSTNCTGRVVLSFCVTCTTTTIAYVWYKLTMTVSRTLKRPGDTERVPERKSIYPCGFGCKSPFLWARVPLTYHFAGEINEKCASHRMFVRAPLSFPFNRSSVCAYLNSNS